jgi:hypothetical protein
MPMLWVWQRLFLASGWEDRLQPLCNFDGKIIAHCLEIHDVAISKLVAGRDKDFEFLSGAISSGLISASILIERLELARSQVENDTIPNRISKWIGFLRKRDAASSTIGIFEKFLEDKY